MHVFKCIRRFVYSIEHFSQLHQYLTLRMKKLMLMKLLADTSNDIQKT